MKKKTAENYPRVKMIDNEKRGRYICSQLRIIVNTYKFVIG